MNFSKLSFRIIILVLFLKVEVISCVKTAKRKYSISLSRLENVKVRAISDALISAIHNDVSIKMDKRLQFLIVHKNCEDFALKIIENVMKETSNVSSAKIKLQGRVETGNQTIIFMDSDLALEEKLRFEASMSNIESQNEVHIVIFERLAEKGKFLVNTTRLSLLI